MANSTAYSVEGDGAPVLLVHGMGLNRHMWQWQLPPLARRFKTIRYDLLGHGDSVQRPGPYVLSDFANQIAELLDHLDVERCALVGFSLGGMIVRAAAIAHPNRVSALAILNSPHDRSESERAAMMTRLDLALQHGPQSTIDAALARWFTESFAEKQPETLKQVRAWMNANDPEIYPEIYRVLATGDAEIAESIATIRCPTLVLACGEDHGNSPDMARRMAALIPGAQTSIIPMLKHMGLAEDPDAISSVLVPFLEEALA
ncbi:MAG: alpha/beta fold hydrolase [Rhodospirillaceae bacterium]|jgi:(E)-2-((N-methylformamido)methylene)succinate hydrolase|nr:alpha/beta fold hydrolase [Rhodospirillaceae bacterium]